MEFVYKQHVNLVSVIVGGMFICSFALCSFVFLRVFDLSLWVAGGLAIPVGWALGMVAISILGAMPSRKRTPSRSAVKAVPEDSRDQ